MNNIQMYTYLDKMVYNYQWHDYWVYTQFNGNDALDPLEFNQLTLDFKLPFEYVYSFRAFGEDGRRANVTNTLYLTIDDVVPELNEYYPCNYS